MISHLYFLLVLSKWCFVTWERFFNFVLNTSLKSQKIVLLTLTLEVMHGDVKRSQRGRVEIGWCTVVVAEEQMRRWMENPWRCAVRWEYQLVCGRRTAGVRQRQEQWVGDGGRHHRSSEERSGTRKYFLTFYLGLWTSEIEPLYLSTSICVLLVVLYL
jgi:hypothetical protein